MGRDVRDSIGSGSSTARQPRLFTRDFTFLWWSQMISQIGDGVTKLALLWFVYSITGSAVKTTIIGMLQTLPPILFGPLIGVYLDRFPKKPILVAADVTRAVVIGLIPCWVSVDGFTVERLYLLVLLHALASAIFGPGLTSVVPFLMPRERYTAANGLLQSTTSLGVIVGPALSGLGIAAFTSQEVLCVNAATYLLSAACLLPVRLPAGRASLLEISRPQSIVHDLFEGFRFTLVGQPTLRLLIVIAAVHTFGTAAFSTLFPVFGRTLLDLGPVEVGYLWSAFGIGLLVISLALVTITGWTLTWRVRAIAISSVMTAGTFYGLGGAPGGSATAILMGLNGASVGLFTPIAWAVVQELSPGNMVGRALTIYTTGAMVSAIIGMTLFGWVTQAYGAAASLYGLGAILLLAAGLASGFERWLQRRGAHPPTV